MSDSVTLTAGPSTGFRTRRMGGIIHPSTFPSHRLDEHRPDTPPDSPEYAPPSPMSSISSYSTLSSPPPPPPRSPLRPSTKSVASFTTLVNLYSNRDTILPPPLPSNPELLAEKKRSIASFTALLDQLHLSEPSVTPSLMSDTEADEYMSDDKPLPTPPGDSSVSGSSSPTPTLGLAPSISMSSNDSTLAPSVPVVSKREHALKELLSSERAYASDLAFIRNVHIPVALGKQAPFNLPRPLTPPSSSGSSSRTMSSSSASSTSSHGQYGPPMTKEDVRLIFGNITELALFAENFSERLQDALGDVLEDGKGEDWVGALFLQVIPKLEPPYMHYITKHPNALKHLASLPQTPALAHYLSQTQALASSVTHAWDLPSLLIKPVQRLLKYPLLLSSILEQTPDGHWDKGNLKRARDRMEEVARAVNESRRRAELVKEILTGKTDIGKPTALQKKLSISKSAQVGVGRMKSMGMGIRNVRPKEEDNAESITVLEQERQLKQCESFMREFAKDIVTWAQTVRATQTHLRTWAVDFGKTIGISDDLPSEAFTAFLDLIDSRLMPLCHDLDDVVAKQLLPELARLVDSAKQPLRLLSVMRTYEPLHQSLLHGNYAKNRPPPSLIESSQTFVALRGQLAAELPKYLNLLDKGIAACIRRFAKHQTEFWSGVRDQWGTLWDCLRMEGETNAGCEETLTLWWARYSEVDAAVSGLTMLKRERPAPSRQNSRPTNVRSTSFKKDPPNAVSSLPPHSPFNFFSSPTLPTHHRSRGSLDSVPTQNIRQTLESLAPLHSNRHAVPSYESGLSISAPQRVMPQPRSRSRPGAGPRAPTPDALSSTQVRGTHNHAFSFSAARDYADSIDQQHHHEIRGRKSRSSSLSRRLSETLRQPLHRSPSQKSINSQRSIAYSSGSKPSSLKLNMETTALDDDFTPPLDSPSLYYVSVSHPCHPPDGAFFRDLPFFQLKCGDLYGVVSELGHPSLFEDLCVGIDEGADDCLLVVKNEDGDIGLALATFLVPLS